MQRIETIKNDRFCLHDSAVSKIEFCDRDLLLTFSEGFWETDITGKMIRQKNNCKLRYKFKFAEDGERNLFVFKVSSKKKKEIKFSDFAEAVKKYGFRIYREFRCGFTAQIILEGNTAKGCYSILTEELEEVVYEFYDD